MKKTIKAFTYSSFLLGVSSLPLNASYFTLPNSILTLNDHTKYTSCDHGNALTYLGVIRTAARHSIDIITSESFIGKLNNIILRHDCDRNWTIADGEYTYVQSCLAQLKTYKSIENHVIKPTFSAKISKEDLLQTDIHYGIALIEGIINAAQRRSKHKD